MTKRLNIVVPYRDRAAHLAEFLPHLRSYFARDKVDSKIPYSITIVQQEAGLPFNRGALKNIGFLLGEENSDYTCFHDVDYLPIWADYAWADRPTALVWFGADQRPAGSNGERLIVHDLEQFFGGAVLAPNKMFKKVDGYSNAYWGWGFEDVDLQKRYQRAGIKMERRKGTFRGLDHVSEAFKADGSSSGIGLVNKQLFDQKWLPGAKSTGDGLSSLSYEILERQSIPDSLGERLAPCEMVTVRLALQPSPEQILALVPPNVSRATRTLQQWLAAVIGK